jgi:flagellar biosynthetic protein FliP
MAEHRARSRSRKPRSQLRRLVVAILLGIGILFAIPTAASAENAVGVAPSLARVSTLSANAGLSSPNALAAAGLLAAPKTPTTPTDPSAPVVPDSNVSISVPGQPSQVVSIIVLVTLLGVAPSILLLCTSFTKIVVVLSLARSALGTPSIPPNQVLVGLALFLSLFVMGPTIDQMQKQAVQPYSAGKISATEAYHRGVAPLQSFMLKHTRDEELALMTKAADEPLPKDRNSVDLRTLIPAFVLSELRGAFIIGFVIFIPFLVVDIVVSAILMSLGMVMLPPSLVSLPFKLLLFVLVDGWSLIITTLIGSYH